MQRVQGKGLRTKKKKSKVISTTTINTNMDCYDVKEVILFLELVFGYAYSKEQTEKNEWLLILL